MSLVSWPCRKSLASAPVSASFPRSERSTTNVVTDETLALLQARQPSHQLALELVHHAVARNPRGERAAHPRGLLGAVEPLEQGEPPLQVKRDLHVYALRQPIMPLVEEF